MSSEDHNPGEQVPEVADDAVDSPADLDLPSEVPSGEKGDSAPDLESQSDEDPSDPSESSDLSELPDSDDSAPSSEPSDSAPSSEPSDSALSSEPSGSTDSDLAAQPNLDDLVAELDRQSFADAEQKAAAPDPTAEAFGSGGTENLERFIQFSLAGTRYAVPVGTVTEVGEVPPVTPVPNVPGWVLGVSNLRGEVLAVIDLSVLLGLPRDQPIASGRMLVARSGHEETTAGLVVDEVNGATSLDRSELRPPTAEVESTVSSYLIGVAEREQRVLAVIDLAKLLDSPEVRRFGVL